MTFTDEVCVDRCMEKRSELNDEYGITMKRLLPDTITKCQRLVSTPEIVIRITSPGKIKKSNSQKFLFFSIDSLFTDTNIRSYFSKYGKIMDVKMLDEEDTAGICLIIFQDFDSSDRVLIDIPHYLNGQLLSIHKYTAPEYVCSLSQFRLIDERKAHEVKRWYPLLRNLNDLIQPLNILYKTQLALIKYNMTKQISISNQNLNKTKENLLEFENKYNDIKQNFIHLCYLNEQIKAQIEDSRRKIEKNKNEYEDQIEQQRKKNKSLQDAITYLQQNS